MILARPRLERRRARASMQQEPAMEHLAFREDVRAMGVALQRLKRDAVRRIWLLTILVPTLVILIDRSLK
jgi:hypothetical protein